MIVVDTHVLLWRWGNPAKLSKSAARALEKSDTVLVPAIVCWEICLLTRLGRVQLQRPVLEWLHAILDLDDYALANLTPEVADVGAAISTKTLADPADRMVVATAMLNQCPLVTADGSIHDSGLVQCIW
ncbi:MAG: type II toxin-antitoxin system VapC family toxin [Planctomycetes bacterium]|nr:type II toxin-antitoxin system VapC family toxin [Planctomycetota bacterium]